MNDIDIFICTHKDFNNCPSDDKYKICCGPNDLKNNYPIEIFYEQENKYTPIRESLSNISRLYYIWKNYSLKKYIGIVQYNRYFDYSIVDKNLDIDDNTCIVPQPLKLPVVLQYARAHNIKDYIIVREIIKYIFKLSENDIKKTEQKLYCHNIFIMTSKRFNEYCNFLFQTLNIFIQYRNFYTMNNINKEYNGSQNRIIGFLAERIGNIFIQHNFSNIIEYNILNNFALTNKNNI